MIGISFENRHDEDKTLEECERENSSDHGFFPLHPAELAIGCQINDDGSPDGATGVGCHQPDCIVDYRPPNPGTCPFAKYGASSYAVFNSGDQASLRLLVIGCQQEREQVQTRHIFCEKLAEVVPRRIFACFLSRDSILKQIHLCRFSSRILGYIVWRNSPGVPLASVGELFESRVS